MSIERQRRTGDKTATIATDVAGLRAPVLESRRGYRFSPENLVWPSILREAGHPNLPTDATILDLGAGCGILGLLAAEAVYGGAAHLTLVERNEEHVALCEANAACTGATVSVVAADHRGWTPPAPAHLIVANPPFFRPGEGQPSRHATTRESTHAYFGDVGAFCDTIARTLCAAPDAEAWLLYPANQLAEAMAAVRGCGLHTTGLWLLYATHKPDHSPYRAWIRLSHTAAPLRVETVERVG